MFTAIKNLFGFREETPVKAFIATTNDGRFALETGGQTVGTYARRRDAIRGAARRELTIVNA